MTDDLIDKWPKREENDEDGCQEMSIVVTTSGDTDTAAASRVLA